MNEPTQTGRRARTTFWILGALLWALAFAALYFVWTTSRELAEQKKTTAAEPVALNDAGSEQASLAGVWDPKGIQDFELTERSGETITKEDLLGKPWVVNFIFTRCAGPCLQLTGEMARLQELLKEHDLDARLVTITVDPDYDSPEVLRKYAEGFGADPQQWLFLTGDKDKTYELIRDSFKMPVKEMTGEDRKPGWEVLHTTNILLVDAQGKVLGKYNGVDQAQVSKLIRTLRDMEEESAEAGSQEESATGESAAEEN